MLPAQSLRFRETGGRFWGECQLYHRKFSNCYCLLFCFNSNCNRLLSQIKTSIFHFLSTQKLETINDVLSISLLIGSIVDRLEINSSDFVVSYHYFIKWQITVEILSRYLENMFILGRFGNILFPLNRTIARWHHFTTTTRILQFVVFLCKLELLFFNPQRDWQI